ncbi:transposase [Mangrovicoccus ximenensis]|uniref:transposase n=1 Tax=Mangrovicoccus ximenensis TaxID=1911570 RepID=UPI000D336E45
MIRGILSPANAIRSCLTLKVPLRRTVGLVASLIEMAGRDWPVPGHAALCRRAPCPARRSSWASATPPVWPMRWHACIPNGSRDW